MSALDDKIEILVKKISYCVFLNDLATLAPLIKDLMVELQAEDRPRWRGTSAGIPATPTYEGDLYYDSVTMKVYIYANGTWTALN